MDQAWERIGVTGNHPIWSEDRHDYVAAMDLRVGERLKNLSGDTVWVQQKLPRPGPTPVYNLEVQDEHVYYVGANGVLAHNAGEDLCKTSGAASQLAEQIAGPGRRLAGQVETIANMRPFVDRMRDAMANPGKWMVIRSVTEPSSALRNRGGTSLQELLRNEETGETIIRHTLFRKDGRIFDPAHFRDKWK